jgi:hypothetical protein
MNGQLDALIDAGIAALVVLLPVVIGIITYRLEGYLKQLRDEAENKVGKEKLDRLLAFTEVMIRAAEQFVNLDTDEKKKDFVAKKVSEWVLEYDLPLDADQIDAIIEGIYNGMKNPVGAETAGKFIPAYK